MALDPQEQILPICKELGIGFVCWSPLAMGLLTGTVSPETQFARSDFRAAVPWFAPENRAANLQRVAVVQTWARRKNATPGQVSLAWLAAQAPWVVTIPGTTKMLHMLENNGADAVRFSSAELAAFNADLAHTPVHGARLPQGVLGLSGVEAPKKQA